MIKKEDIKLSGLKVGCVIEFETESLSINNELGDGTVVYEHSVWGERGPMIPNFLSTHCTRTPFVVEKINGDVVKLRSATAVCDHQGNLLKNKKMNLRTEITKAMLFYERTGLHYWYIYALYDNLHECIKAHGNEISKCGSIGYEIKVDADVESFSDIVGEMLETYIKKNHDYGNAFSEMYDELGINYGYGKIREKVNRIKTLKDGYAMVENEPLEDALLNCANYCILTLMEYQKHKENGKG